MFPATPAANEVAGTGQAADRGKRQTGRYRTGGREPHATGPAGRRPSHPGTRPGTRNLRAAGLAPAARRTDSTRQTEKIWPDSAGRPVRPAARNPGHPAVHRTGGPAGSGSVLAKFGAG